MLRGNGVALIEQGDAGIVDPGAKDDIQRKLAAPEIIGDILRLHRMRSLIGDLVRLIAVVNLGDIALFGDFDPLFVGKLSKAPEQHPVAGRAAVKKTIGTSALLHVAHSEVGLAAESLNGLIEQRPGSVRILLIGIEYRGNRSGLFALQFVLWRRLRPPGL